jgi:hypothetical protein
MKKSVAASLLLLGAVTAPVAAAQNTDPSGEITVTAWDVAEALEGVVAGFNEEYPNVQVTVENLGNQQVYDRGLAGCAAGGADLPDVYAVRGRSLLEPLPRLLHRPYYAGGRRAARPVSGLQMDGADARRAGLCHPLGLRPGGDLLPPRPLRAFLQTRSRPGTTLSQRGNS